MRGRTRATVFPVIAAYILHCGDNTYYVGSTWDLDARMQQHAAGKGSVYTSTRLPRGVGVASGIRLGA